MKKHMKIFATAILFLTLNLGFVFVSFADTPPPPPPPGHGTTGNVPGGGAAIGGGVLILALLGAGYGAKKWYDKNKRNLAE